MKTFLNSSLSNNACKVVAASALAAFLMTTGCSPKTTESTGTGTNVTTDDHAHDDHDHDAHAHHEHGAHGGEMVLTEPGDLKVEWTHDHDDGAVVMYVDEITAAGKTVEAIKVSVDADGSVKDYVLEKQEDGSYLVKDLELVTAIDASAEEGSKIKAMVVVTVEGQDQTGRLINFHH